MKALRRGLSALAASVVAAAVFALPAGAAAEEIHVVADGGARAFALRPSVDQGGANPLNFYVGYADANVTTPEPQADGQASWYNLNIAETALFQDPEDCTPEKNLQATLDGVTDVQTWGAAYLATAIDALSQGQQPPLPDVPSVRHACSERFPGFAQSRYPSTTTIPESAQDDLLTKPLCDDPNSCDAWTTLKTTTSPLLTDGSFASTADGKPSAGSAGAMTNLGDGMLISVAFAQTRAAAKLVGSTIVVESTDNLVEICIGRTPAGCQLYIDEIRQHALIRRTAGKKPVTESRTVILGLRRLGTAGEENIVTLDDTTLPLGSIPCCYEGDSGSLSVEIVGKTRDCVPAGGSSSFAVADAGGLRIFGKGTAGGAIMLGGACARARVSEVSIPIFTPPQITPPQIIPGGTTVIPGTPGGSSGDGRVGLGPVRIVTKEIVSYTTRRAAAWRLAPWWGSVLGALAALTLAGVRFRNTVPVRPVSARIDRFSRQFLRG